MPAESSKSLLYRLFVQGMETHPEIPESRLFRLITLPNGTTKNTSPNRLDALNEFLLPYLPQHSPLLLKDIAVSSGISTLEWLEFLEANHRKTILVATDLYVKAYLCLKSPFAILCDKDSNPLLIEVGNAFYRTSFPKGSWRYGWGKFISNIIRHTIITTKMNDGSRIDPAGAEAMIPVELLTRGLRKNSSISFEEEDILQPPAKKDAAKFDAIRAANILNNVYFSGDEIKKIIGSLAIQLKPSGMLLISKTDDKGVNHASLFSRGDDRFKLVKKLHDGSEVESLVLQSEL